MLPIPDAVRGASEILGLDPLHIANEGLVLVILPDEKTEQALADLCADPQTSGGLLAALPAERAEPLLAALREFAPHSVIVGRVEPLQASYLVLE